LLLVELVGVSFSYPPGALVDTDGKLRVSRLVLVGDSFMVAVELDDGLEEKADRWPSLISVLVSLLCKAPIRNAVNP
jgi:hypothetical protein